LYRVVPDILAGDADQSRALRLLQEAQDILLGDTRQYYVAEYKVAQAKSLLVRRTNVDRWSNTYGWAIFFYGVLWIAVLLLGLFYGPRIVSAAASAAGTGKGFGEAALLGLWNTMIWGGLGGVIGAFYSLYWHVAKVRDFDRQYSMWYIVQPVIGLLLGALVYLLVGSGLAAVRGETQSGMGVGVSPFSFAVACIAGFRQRSILEMIDRVFQVMTPSHGREEASAGDLVEGETSKPSG
jgi:hypothetical protein